MVFPVGHHVGHLAERHDLVDHLLHALLELLLAGLEGHTRGRLQPGRHHEELRGLREALQEAEGLRDLEKVMCIEANIEESRGSRIIEKHILRKLRSVHR